MKLNGEILTVISWLQQSGYEVSIANKTVTRNKDSKRKDYLENRAKDYGFEVRVEKEASRIPQTAAEYYEDRRRMLEMDREQQRKANEEKRRKLLKAARKRCQEASPTKVIGKLLGTSPLTEREQAIMDYYQVLWGPQDNY